MHSAVPVIHRSRRQVINAEWVRGVLISARRQIATTVVFRNLIESHAKCLQSVVANGFCRVFSVSRIVRSLAWHKACMSNGVVSHDPPHLGFELYALRRARCTRLAA